MPALPRIARWLFACALAWVGTLSAQIWTGASSATWTAAGNWNGGVPGNTGTATFSSSTSRDPNIGTGTVEIGDLVFSSGTDAETFAGAGTLLIHGTGGAGITHTAGVTVAFTGNIALGSSQTWTVANDGGNASILNLNHLLDLDGHTLTIDTGAGSTVGLTTGTGDIVSSTTAGGAIVKNGEGTLTFAGNTANTFDGGFTLNAGTVSIRNPGSLGTGTLTLAGGVLTTAADKAMTNDLVVSGVATLQGAAGIDYTFSSNNVSGSGTLTLENSTGSGTVMTANFSGTGFDLAAGINLGAVTELRLRHASGTQTYSGVISGSGAVRQNVAGGTALLTGTNTFTGGVVLDAGTLSAGNDSALGTGTIDLSGGTLTSDSSRTFANNLTLSGNSTIAGGADVDFLFTSDSITGGSGILTLDNTADSGVMSVGFSGSGFTFSRAIVLSDAYTVLRLLNTTGTQTFSGGISGSGGLVRDVAGGTTVLSGSGSYTGGVVFSAGTLALGSNSALGTGTLTWSGGTLQSNGGGRSIGNAVALGGDVTLAGADGFTFTGGLTQSGGDRTISVVNTGVTTFSTGSLVLAENNQARTLTLDVDGTSGGVVIGSVIADGAGSGADGLTKNGGGTLTLNGANTYTGTTTLNAGLVVLGNNSAFGSGAVALNGAALSLTSDRTLANNLTLAGDTAISGLGYSDLLFTSDSIVTTGGSLTLHNTDGSGTMSVGFSGNGFDFTRAIVLADAFTELRALNTAGTQTYSGVISGAGVFHQNGAGGTVALDGANTFSGGILLDAGTLRVGHDTALGTGTLTLHGGTLFATADRTLANALALTGSSTIAGANGTDIVFMSDTIGGNSGTLTLQNTSGSGTASVGFSGAGFDFNRNVAFADANTALRFANTSGTQTFSAAISGAGTLVRAATGGTTALTANNGSFSGAVSIEGGTLSFSQNNSLGTGTVTLGGGTLQTDGSTRTLANALALTANSTLGGAGALTLTGGLTQSGGNQTLAITNTALTTLSGAALTLAENNQARTLTVDVDGASGGLNISSVIQNGAGTGADGLTKTGLGRLTLSGANTFTGLVNVNAGTLAALGTNAVGGFAVLGDHSWVTGPTPTTVITVADGATLEVQSSFTGGYGDSNTQEYQTLSLSGAGVGGVGALNATGGNNTWLGNITLAGDTTIRNSAIAGDPNALVLGAMIAFPAVSPPTDFKLNDHALTLKGTGDIFISDQIGASGGDTGTVTVDMTDTASTVYFAGRQNYYTGATDVKNGTLALFIDPGNHANAAILGDLTIGDGTGAANSAIVREFYSDQIADNRTVTINADGQLDLGTYGTVDTVGPIVLNGGRILTTGGNNGTLNLGGDITANATSSIDGGAVSGGLMLNNAVGEFRTFTVATSATLNFNAVLGGNGGFIKAGDGTMIMSRDSTYGYYGVTDVQAGTLNLRSSGALGQASNSNPAKGTIVRDGATLQLENTAGNIAIGAENLVLNGAGQAAAGALNSKSGVNSWAGLVTLESSSTVKVDAGSLTLSGQVTGSAVAQTQTLTVDGAGDTAITSNIFDHRVDVTTDSHAGTLALTKNGSGTLTLSNVNSFTGAVNVAAGTLAANATDAFGGHNAVDVANGATLTFSGATTNTLSALTGGTTSTAGGLVSIGASASLIVNHATADSFSGRLTGSGLFEKQGAGTFTFESPSNTAAFNFAGEVKLAGGAAAGTLEFKGGLGALNVSADALAIGTLTLTGGTLLLTNAFINVGTLHITGNTILDFGTAGRSILNATNIYIDVGAVLTVVNWDSEIDFLFANSDFRVNSGAGQIAIRNEIGTGGAYTPENQVWFQGDPQSPDGSHTTWIDNATNYYDYANHEIRPVPEPSTYGALLLGGCLALVGWRRFRPHRGRRVRAPGHRQLAADRFG